MLSVIALTRTALRSVLQEKYLIPPDEADGLAAFLEPQLQLDPLKRATAWSMTSHGWLEGIVVAGDELPGGHDGAEEATLTPAVIEQTAVPHSNTDADIAEAVSADPNTADALKPLAPKNGTVAPVSSKDAPSTVSPPKPLKPAGPKQLQSLKGSPSAAEVHKTSPDPIVSKSPPS